MRDCGRTPSLDSLEKLEQSASPWHPSVSSRGWPMIAVALIPLHAPSPSQVNDFSTSNPIESMHVRGPSQRADLALATPLSFWQAPSWPQSSLLLTWKPSDPEHAFSPMQ